MNNLNNSTSTFKVPTWDNLTSGTNEQLVFMWSYGMSENMYETAISVKPLNILSEENEIAVRQIKSLTNLSDNWDFEGAKKISKRVIDRAIHWVRIINAFDQNIYFVSPGPNGEVMLLLKLSNKELEIILYSDKEKFVQFENKNFVEQGNIVPENFTEIIDWYSRIK